jgi:adenylate cyclase
MRRWVDLIIPFLILLGPLLLRFQDPQVIVELRNRVFDVYQRLEPRPYVPQPVRILDIDEDSMRSLGQWPWPRDLMARIVNRLTQAGAAAVALDILQQEPDRTGPASLLQQWQARPDRTTLRDRKDTVPGHGTG